jgi:hypothetical protein
VRKEEKSTPEINEFAMLEPRGSTQVMASWLQTMVLFSCIAFPFAYIAFDTQDY